ncbi:hypothetical protein GMOD_00006552 [Pyrenophora seminiperda CCB06]|uniref:Uncharacterized protein n=1 Tax=Pyrenophora seminiperda CCB06 TaxID=1302712 RepID=A0A3M7MAE5_9PLEO|nr:hypothetical protein GMOD_00006552 [Pyrenophora seminiperda CCB06]
MQSRSRWTDLPDSVNFVEGRKTMELIKPVDHETTVYFKDCEIIAFKTLEGANIWETKGTGEMKLPAGVPVVIIRGQTMVKDS